MGIYVKALGNFFFHMKIAIMTIIFALLSSCGETDKRRKTTKVSDSQVINDREKINSIFPDKSLPGSPISVTGRQECIEIDSISEVKEPLIEGDALEILVDNYGSEKTVLIDILTSTIESKLNTKGYCIPDQVDQEVAILAESIITEYQCLVLESEESMDQIVTVILKEQASKNPNLELEQLKNKVLQSASEQMEAAGYCEEAIDLDMIAKSFDKITSTLISDQKKQLKKKIRRYLAGTYSTNYGDLTLSINDQSEVTGKYRYDDVKGELKGKLKINISESQIMLQGTYREESPKKLIFIPIGTNIEEGQFQFQFGLDIDDNQEFKGAVFQGVYAGGGEQGDWNGTLTKPGFVGAEPSPGTRKVYRTFNPGSGDHMPTHSYGEGAFHVEDEFNFYNDQASAKHPAQPIFRCFDGRSHFASHDTNCEGKNREGELGYLLASDPGDGRHAPLYRCRSGGDHFMSRDSGCEGQTHEGKLGYMLK